MTDSQQVQEPQSPSMVELAKDIWGTCPPPFSSYVVIYSLLQGHYNLMQQLQ